MNFEQWLKLEWRMHHNLNETFEQFCIRMLIQRCTELESDNQCRFIKVLEKCDELKESQKKIAELEAELAECKERMLKAETVCKEASDYLETNAHTNIAHGSILHRMFQGIHATVKAKEIK